MTLVKLEHDSNVLSIEIISHVLFVVFNEDIISTSNKLVIPLNILVISIFSYTFILTRVSPNLSNLYFLVKFNFFSPILISKFIFGSNSLLNNEISSSVVYTLYKQFI